VPGAGYVPRRGTDTHPLLKRAQRRVGRAVLQHQRCDAVERLLISVMGELFGRGTGENSSSHIALRDR
jgi:hypothetical protein